ncbi:hypothetical protein RB195_005995 [Necator americanus]|uniref:DUF5641 domain-containing protein n=1 Tax=Necator americanus TaxID=51031 RepID=A0ABR1BTM0_NECAM
MNVTLREFLTNDDSVQERIPTEIHTNKTTQKVLGIMRDANDGTMSILCTFIDVPKITKRAVARLIASIDNALEWLASENTNAETPLIMEHYRESEFTLKRLPLDKYNAHRAAVGDVVLIADKNVPRGQWPLVIITTIHRSKTNIPRSATVRTANDHELQRSINQLHPLEISAKKDSQPKKSREELHLTRIQPPRAAKRLRFALGMKQATQPHHLSPDETSSQEILSPTTVRRLLHPIEACHAYAKGNFEPLDTLTIGKQVQHNSLPVEQRCALRLAQSLSLAIHFDHTFTLSQLAARDICMVEPFIRDDYHINLLDMIVEEATIPAPSQLLYPSLQGLPIVTIVQSYRGIHGATTILGKLTSDIAEKTEMAIHHGNYRLDGANNHSVG